MYERNLDFILATALTHYAILFFKPVKGYCCNSETKKEFILFFWPETILPMSGSDDTRRRI